MQLKLGKVFEADKQFWRKVFRASVNIIETIEHIVLTSFP